MEDLDISTYPARIYSNRDEDPKILELINSIFMYRRGYISKIPMNEDVVLIYSGGLDSTILMHKLISEWNNTVYPLFVRRSARATPYEEESAEFFVDFYNSLFSGKVKPLEIVEIEVPPLKFKKYQEKDRLQRLGHPLRNAVLQSLGVQYAQKLRATESPNIHTVLTATVGDDSFPHSCLTALRSVNLTTCLDTGDWDWLVTSPLIDTEYEGRPQFKTDLIKYAIENKIPLEKTRTCIEGGEPDGTCAECLSRIKAFKQANFVDPINYK